MHPSGWAAEVMNQGPRGESIVCIGAITDLKRSRRMIQPVVSDTYGAGGGLAVSDITSVATSPVASPVRGPHGAPGPDQIHELSAAARRMLLAIGDDPDREGLRRTPERMAKAIAYLTSGATMSGAEVLESAIFHDEYDEMVLVKDIEFYSLCEHHLLPFYGRAHIAYVPDGRIVGLSKLPRLLEVHARRLQVQERLTREVADTIDKTLRPRGVAVRIEAAHFCMMMRGVEKQDPRTVTSIYRGDFKTSGALRQEFLAAVGDSRPLE
jgi:GTP cyclohydrolase I